MLILSVKKEKKKRSRSSVIALLAICMLKGRDFIYGKNLMVDSQKIRNKNQE
jgi:hypothetical protein